MVERCNCTIEDCIRKVLQNENDWALMLPSLWFSIQTSVHSSTGFLPYHMMYNKDLILPFQYADKINNAIHDTDNDDIDYLGDNESDTQPDSTLQLFTNLNNSTKRFLKKLRKRLRKLKNIKPNITIEGTTLAKLLK